MSKFPGPYLNDTKKDESIMKYVPTDSLGIGARASGMPKKVGSGGMGIDHVGGAAGGATAPKGSGSATS